MTSNPPYYLGISKKNLYGLRNSKSMLITMKTKNVINFQQAGRNKIKDYSAVFDSIFGIC